MRTLIASFFAASFAARMRQRRIERERSSVHVIKYNFAAKHEYSSNLKLVSTKLQAGHLMVRISESLRMGRASLSASFRSLARAHLLFIFLVHFV